MAVAQNAPVQGRISKIYDHLYANAPVKTPAAIAYEFGKLAHACLYREQKTKGLAFPLPHKNAARLLSESTTVAELARDVRAAFVDMAVDWEMYDDDREVRLSDYDLAYCIAQIGDLRFSDPKYDLLGDIFEIIRSQFAKEKGGQFFTDPQVTHLAMKLLEFDPLAGDDLVDICAGTGGFLLAGMAHLEERAEAEGQDQVSELVARTFHGVEIDPDAAEAANAAFRARFGTDVGKPVQVADSLRFQLDGTPKGIRPGKHRCAATNPPFGTKITIKDPTVLSSFELARISARDGKMSERLSPQAPDTLFLEQNLSLLQREAGRLAIVMPYQLISGPQAVGIREWLIRHAVVHAVVDLPADTFQPHTGTKGALVLLSRRAKPLSSARDAKGESIFMSMPRHIGHDRRGNAIYRKREDGTLTNEILTDFGDVANAYRAFKDGRDMAALHDRCFDVRIENVAGSELLNLNAAFYVRGPSVEQLQASGDVEFKRLGDLVERLFFPGRFKRNYVSAETDGAIPFMGGAGITEFIPTGRKWLSRDDPNLEKLRVRSGWILVTRSGSTGIISTVPDAWDGVAVSEHVIRIVPDAAKMAPGYIYAVLASSYGQQYLRRGVFGSVIDEITPEYVAEMPVPIPRDGKLVNDMGAVLSRAEKERSEAMSTFEAAVQSIDSLLAG